MLKYRCIVLDHDDTVVQTEKNMGFVYFTEVLARFRPGVKLTFEDYVRGSYGTLFADMCRERWQFTEEELQEEYLGWKDYVRTHIPEIYPGMDRIIHRQKAEGGLVCVVSLSGEENIARDYAVHFGVQPDIIYGWDRPREQRKPGPFPLQDIMSRYGLKPEEILVVDDLKLAWQMANPLGVPVAYAAWSKADFPDLSEEMRQLCDYAFDDVESLEQFLFEI